MTWRGKGGNGGWVFGRGAAWEGGTERKDIHNGLWDILSMAWHFRTRYRMKIYGAAHMN